MGMNKTSSDKPVPNYSAAKIWFTISVILTIFFSVRLYAQYHFLDTGEAKYIELHLESVDEKHNRAIYSNGEIKEIRIVNNTNLKPSVTVLVMGGKIWKKYTILSCFPLLISWIFVPISVASGKEEYYKSMQKWEAESLN